MPSPSSICVWCLSIPTIQDVWPAEPVTAPRMPDPPGRCLGGSRDPRPSVTGAPAPPSQGGTSDRGGTMRIFVAGATGAVGKPLVPMLVAAGHEVVAMTRSPGKTDQLRAIGVTPAVADGLDRRAVVDAIVEAKPDAVIHQLTALAAFRSLKHWDREWEQTNRLRTEGTDNLLEGALAAGASRFVAQSYAGWPYAREGGPVKSEEDPFDPNPPAGCAARST